MNIMYNNKSPNIKLYCNSLGELFNPDHLVPMGNSLIPADLPSLVHLPLSLQRLYELYWSDGLCGALNYIVELDGQPCLNLVYEFGIKVLNETVIPAAERIEQSLSSVCPQARVYVGDCTGFKERNELSIFIPANAGDKAICHALYVLHVYGDMNSVDLPSSAAEIVESPLFDKFMAEHCNFSAVRGLDNHHQGQPSHLVEFRESGCGPAGAVMTARVVSSLPLEKIKQILNDNIYLIKVKAALSNKTVDPDDLIARALNADFAGAWVWTSVPALSIQF